MTSATDELRRLLDERGVKWKDYGYDNHVWWGDWHAENRHSVNGLHVKVEAVITPEQAIAATLGQGTLTAEDVRSFLNRNSVFDDTTWTHGRQELVFDEDDLQAMADELNATLGCGTCKDVGIPGDFACSACGARMFTENNDGHTMCLADKMTIIESPNYCPNCGAKVVI